MAHLTTDIAVKQTECGMRLDCDARKLLAAALSDPRALQAKLLDLTFDRVAVHWALCVSLSPRSDLAAHQLQVANTGRSVCSDFAAWLRKHLGQEDEDAQEVEIDARRLWEEIPSPCWMLWFVFDVATDVQDAGITDEIDRLSETLDADVSDEIIDPAKCASVRQALPWERVEALLVRAGSVEVP